MKEPKKILVVDADRVTCELLEKALKKEGYEVETTSDAVKAFNKTPVDSMPDLMITDVVLPGTDGFEFIQSFRGHDDTRNIKVIICSMKASLEDIKKGFAAGADQYIAKPFEPDSVVACVREILGDQKTEVEPRIQIGQQEKGATEESWMDFRRRLALVGEDRRRYPRLEFHCPVRIHGIKGVKRVTDIGMGGVFVEYEQATVKTGLKMGQTFHLVMKLPTEREPVKVTAKVANVRDSGIGFKFVDLTPASQDIIRFCFNTFKDTIPLR